MIIRSLATFIVPVAIWALASGCASSRHDGFATGGATELFPKLTSVLTGPAGMLLTNGSAFSSEFLLTFDDGTDNPSQASGQMLVFGGKLRVEAVFDRPNHTSKVAGEFGLIWDAAANQGFVFSEDLQGYAPINATIRYSNVLTSAVNRPGRSIDGHAVDQANATAMGSDGQTVDFRLLVAQDLDHLPVQISSINSPRSFTLALAKIRPATPQADLFSPPDGFTKYESEAAMLNEMTSREQGILGARQKDSGVNINYKPPGDGQN